MPLKIEWKSKKSVWKKGTTTAPEEEQRSTGSSTTTTTYQITDQDNSEDTNIQNSLSISLLGSSNLNPVPIPNPSTTGNNPSVQEVVQTFDKGLHKLLSNNDPILKDLDWLKDSSSSGDVAAACGRLKALLAFESGQGIRVNLKREDGSILPVHVRKSATVGELKTEIRNTIETETISSNKRTSSNSQSQGSHLKIIRRKNISWAYVWRNNYLHFEGQALKDNAAHLKFLGISNRSQVNLIKKKREKKRTKKRSMN